MISLLTLILVGGWQQCAPMPTPGYGFACAAVGSRVFAIGGLVSAVDSAVPRLAVEAYDVAADSWVTDFEPLPAPRWYAGCAVLDGKVYVIGGTDGNVDLSRVDRFDPVTNTWDTLAPLPWRRSALAGCAFEGRIYAIGGFSAALGTYQRSVARFTPDSATGQWDVVDSLLTRRTSPAAAVAGDRMCAVGGVYGSPLSTFEFYTLPDSWTQSFRKMRLARTGAAAVGWGNWLCAIGGQGRYGPLSSTEVLDVPDPTDYWQFAAPLSEARAFGGAAMVDGYVVVIGGKGERGVIPGVEKADSTLFPGGGIEEPQTPLRVQNAGGWATVAAGRARIACRYAAIYDGSGRRLFAGPGPVDVRLAPGVYFARVTGPDGRLVTGTVTVAR